MASAIVFLSSDWKKNGHTKALNLCKELEKILLEKYEINCPFGVASSDLAGKEISINLYDIGALDPFTAGTIMDDLKGESVQFSWMNQSMIEEEQVVINLCNCTLVV